MQSMSRIRPLRPPLTPLVALLFLPPLLPACSDDEPPHTNSTPDASPSIDGGIASPDAQLPTSDGGPPLDATLDASSRCSPILPTGTCPTGRVCVTGGCVVDFDPGTAVSASPTPSALFTEIWSVYDTIYGAFPAKTVDWDAVRARYAPLVAAATSQFDVDWLVAQAVSEIGDGHTCAMSATLCQAASGIGVGISNTGACVTEVDGRFLVYRLGRSNPMDFAVGDEVLAIDGRSMEEAIHDLDLQPRCQLCYSTEAQHRTTLVDSILFRAGSDRLLSRRRAGVVEDVPIEAQRSQSWIECDGRIGVGGVTQHSQGITSKLLSGDVLYIYLPIFGGYDVGGQFVADPVLPVLRDLFAQAVTRKGVVLDVRGNPGGFATVYMALASWLYPTATELFSCRSKAGPGRDQHGPSFPMLSEPDPQLSYSGPLALLTSARTFSAGDFLAGFLHQTGRARTFGAPTGGGFGSAASRSLRTWTLGYNDILCTGLNGSLLEGHPPAVASPVAYSASDVQNAVDPVVEQARLWVVSEPSP